MLCGGPLKQVSALGEQLNFLSPEFPLTWLKQQDVGPLTHSCIIGAPSTTLHRYTSVLSMPRNINPDSNSRPLAGASRQCAMDWAVTVWGQPFWLPPSVLCPRGSMSPHFERTSSPNLPIPFCCSLWTQCMRIWSYGDFQSLWMKQTWLQLICCTYTVQGLAALSPGP